MSSPTIIYYGVAGLPADILDAYFHRLGLDFQRVQGKQELLNVVRAQSRPVIVLALNEPPANLIELARKLIPDPSSAFPHIFILYEGEPFDAQLEPITVLTGQSKLSKLADQITVLQRLSLANR